MKTLNEILEIEGIVLRLVPKGEYTEKWRTYVNGKVVIEEKKRNNGKLANKWLTTFCHDTSSQVRYYKGLFGVGDTIEESYQDYLKKNS